MTALPGAGREIPADVRALVRNLRLMPDKARLAGAFEADCCSAADLIEARAARLASLEALLHDIASDCRPPTAHAGNALRQIGDKIERAMGGAPTKAASLEAERAKTVEAYHEDYGFVTWWCWRDSAWLGEPAWIGSPLCEDWPGYHTHWTPHPKAPAPPALASEKGGPA